jgi:hypothetical protein
MIPIPSIKKHCHLTMVFLLLLAMAQVGFAAEKQDGIWEETEEKNAIESMAVDGKFFYMLSLGHGEILRTDGKAGWTKLPKLNHGFRVFCIHGDFLYAGTFREGVFKIRINGDESFANENWLKVGEELDGRHILSMSSCGKYLYIGTKDGKIYRTEDGGITWVQDKIISQSTHSEIRTLCFHKGNVYAGVGAKTILKTTVGEDKWEKITSPAALDAFYVLYSPIQDEVIKCDNTSSHADFLYMGGDDGKVYRSKDAGKNWDEYQLVSITNPDSFKPDVLSFTARKGEIYAATDQGQVFITQNNGDDWRQFGELQSIRMYLSIHNDNLYAGAGHGLFKTKLQVCGN